jgi:hypothetical protein
MTPGDDIPFSTMQYIGKHSLTKYTNRVVAVLPV